MGRQIHQLWTEFQAGAKCEGIVLNVALRSQPLNILSICTGGAGLDLGVELAIPSARTVCMVEREAFAVAHLVAAMEQGLLHPAPVWSDARTFDGRAWRGSVDGLIGGIPCQPHSLAGRKQGSLDARDLWSDARRIIVQSRAWFVVVENVGGMLAAGADEIAGAQRVFRDLHKLGFETEGGLFTAEEVGAPHERERIFILGVEGVGQADAFSTGLQGCSGRAVRQQQSTAERGREDMDDASIARGGAIPIQPRRQGQASSDFDGAGVGHGGISRLKHMANANRYESSQVGRDTGKVPSAAEGEGGTEHGPLVLGRFGLPTFPPGPGDSVGWHSVLSRAPELEPAFCRMADGMASGVDDARQWGRVDRLRMLGNGVVPLQAAYAVRTLATRLAARGSAAAARLVRMMEGIDA